MIHNRSKLDGYMYSMQLLSLFDWSGTCYALHKENSWQIPAVIPLLMLLNARFHPSLLLLDFPCLHKVKGRNRPDIAPIFNWSKRHIEIMEFESYDCSAASRDRIADKTQRKQDVGLKLPFVLHSATCCQWKICLVGMA